MVFYQKMMKYPLWVVSKMLEYLEIFFTSEGKTGYEIDICDGAVSAVMLLNWTVFRMPGLQSVSLSILLFRACMHAHTHFLALIICDCHS